MNWLVTLCDGENGEVCHQVIFAMTAEQAQDLAEKLSWRVNKGLESVEILE
mgnify:FL=1